MAIFIDPRNRTCILLPFMTFVLYLFFNITTAQLVIAMARHCSIHHPLSLNGVRDFAMILLCTFWISSSFAFVPNMTESVKFSSTEGSIAAYDNAMPEWITKLFGSFIVDGKRWQYMYPDKLANVSQRSGGNLDWVAPISPLFLMKTKSWLVFQRVLKHFTGVGKYIAYQVEGVMLRRGDFPAVIEGDSGSDDVYCNLFLSKASLQNSGILFFDEKGEIAKAVSKKFNRLVVWNSTWNFQLKQPGFQSFKSEYSLLIKFTKDKKKLVDELSYIQAIREDEKKQSMESFPRFNVENDQFTDEFFENHLTRKFYDHSGGVISVFDGILNETELCTLRKYLLKHNTGYTNGGYQTKEIDDGDNVSWIAMFFPEVTAGTKILGIVKGMAKYLSGENGWTPYDVSLNMIQKSFHTRIHSDCEDFEIEYTFLLYLNPGWTEEMYGETIFLNQIQDLKINKQKVIHDKAYETIVSVKPKYGRMVMFRNNIPHSARPPSPDFHGSRYTFAIKVSRTRKMSLAKILRELLENDESSQLFNDMYNGASSGQIGYTPENLLSNITKYRALKMESLLSKENTTVVNLLREKYVGIDQPSV